MREFLKQSFTNPLGNLLAAANLLMIISEEVDLLSSSINGKFVYDLNRPAVIASQFLGGEFTAGLFVLQLVYLQWIFIGGFAKFVALTIHPPEID